MRCKRTLLIFSFVVLGVLVFSAGSMAVLSSPPSVRAVGQFNETLPTADGQITAIEQGYCDHLQLTMDIYGGIPEPYFIDATINIDVYSAYNGTMGTAGSYIYFGIIAHDVPFLANITLDPVTEEPVGLFNLTTVWLRFDNDDDGWIEQDEDKKGVWMGNETWTLGDDSYWNITTDDEDYEYDDDSEGPPTEGDIVAYNMTHDNTTAQGNFGNLTAEMIFPTFDDGSGRDGGGLTGSSTFDVFLGAINNQDSMDIEDVFGRDRGVTYFVSASDTHPNDDDASNFYSLSPKDGGNTPLESNFTTNDQEITANEIGNASLAAFSDLKVYAIGFIRTSTVDIYVANNDTMLYVGVIIEEVPYWANVFLDSTWTQTAPSNLTGVTLQFDNNNNGTVDDLEDMKIVMIGNSSLTIGWDQYYDLADGYYDEDVEVEDAPPEPDDLVAFGMEHSDDTAQGNFGDLSTEMMMPLADDTNGTDGGGLSDTVGFTICYVGLSNGYIDPPEEDGDEGTFLVGSISDLRETHPLLFDFEEDDGNGDRAGVHVDASTFEELEIVPNPVSELALVWLTLISALLVVTVITFRKMVCKRV